MNILFWVLQVLLALHTVIGALWKFSHTAAQTMPSLTAIPDGVWKSMGGFELAIGACLILPAIHKSLAILAPIAAACIAAEMLLFCGLHLYSGDTNYGPIAYWLIVVAICAFIAYGRIVREPL